jgi:glycosyltransferase involved in cell wall biosynthesis
VHFHGLVPDVTDFYSRSRIFVAPTRYSAGVPIKVLDAAAAGLPVVATQLLAKQLGWNDSSQLLVANTAAEFAAACYRLYIDEPLWMRIRANALEKIRSEHDPVAFGQRVASVLTSVVPAGANRLGRQQIKVRFAHLAGKSGVEQ